MIWIGIVLAGALLLLAALYLLGWFLPEQVKGESEVFIPKSPEVVWAALTDPETYPLSAKMCRKVEMLAAEGGLSAWREDIGSSLLENKVVATEELTRLVRESRDTVAPVTMHSECTIESGNGGCTIRFKATTTVKNGTWCAPLFRVTLRLMPNGGPKAYLKMLAEGLE